MITLAYLIIAAVVALLLFRRQWLLYAQHRYLFQLSWYILAKKLSAETITLAMPENVSFWHKLLDIGHWDFGWYVDYGLYSDVQAFFADESNLRELPEIERKRQEEAEAAENAPAVTLTDAEMDELLKEVLAEQGLTAETLKLSDEEFDAAMAEKPVDTTKSEPPSDGA